MARRSKKKTSKKRKKSKSNSKSKKLKSPEKKQELIIKTRSDWIKKALINKKQYEKKYSYSLKKKPVFDYTKWPKFLKKKDTVNIFLNKGLKFRTALARVIIKRSCEFFRKDPYGSVKNKKKFLKQKK